MVWNHPSLFIFIFTLLLLLPSFPLSLLLQSDLFVRLYCHLERDFEAAALAGRMALLETPVGGRRGREAADLPDGPVPAQRQRRSSAPRDDNVQALLGASSSRLRELRQDPRCASVEVQRSLLLLEAQVAADELVNLEQENSGLRGQVATLQTSLNTEQANNRELRHQARASRSQLSAERSVTGELRGRLQSQTRALQQQLATQTRNHTRARDALQEQLTSERTAAAQLRGRVAGIPQLETQIRNQLRARQSLQQQLTAAQLAAARLRGQLASQRQDRDNELAALNARAQEQLDHEIGVREWREDELRSSRQEAAYATSTRNVVMQQRDALRVREAGLERENEALRARVEGAADQSEELRRGRRALQRRSAELRELQQSKRELQQRNQELVEQIDESCSVCSAATARVLFMPCRHLTCCPPCSSALHQCPICNRKIDQKISVYFA